MKHEDPEIQALMDETLEQLAAGKMQPDLIPWGWEPRRENEQTPDYLGRVLEWAGLPELAANARAAHYDDFHAPAEVADGFELLRLVRDVRREAKKVTDPAGNPYRPESLKLRRERCEAIENAARRGEFDATKAESDRYAASKRGQEDLGAVVDSVTKKQARNEPCACGSGRKFKHCHGA